MTSRWVRRGTVLGITYGRRNGFGTVPVRDAYRQPCCLCRAYFEFIYSCGPECIISLATSPSPPSPNSYLLPSLFTAVHHQRSAHRCLATLPAACSLPCPIVSSSRWSETSKTRQAGLQKRHQQRLPSRLWSSARSERTGCRI